MRKAPHANAYLLQFFRHGRQDGDYIRKCALRSTWGVPATKLACIRPATRSQSPDRRGNSRYGEAGTLKAIYSVRAGPLKTAPGSATRHQRRPEWPQTSLGQRPGGWIDDTTAALKRRTTGCISPVQPTHYFRENSYRALPSAGTWCSFATLSEQSPDDIRDQRQCTLLHAKFELLLVVWTTWPGAFEIPIHKFSNLKSEKSALESLLSDPITQIPFVRRSRALRFQTTRRGVPVQSFPLRVLYVHTVCCDCLTVMQHSCYGIGHLACMSTIRQRKARLSLRERIRAAVNSQQARSTSLNRSP